VKPEGATTQMQTAADTKETQPANAAVERRRHERLSVYLRVRWEGMRGRYEGTISDISAGGCFILTEGTAAMRELVRLEIELHTGAWVRVWAEVTNQFAGVGFGVKYTDFDEEDAGKFRLSLEHTKALKLAADALKRVDGAFRPAGDDGSYVPRVGRQEYKALVALALPVVNQTLLELPECQKKTSLRLSVQAYADLLRVWAAMAEGMQAGPRHFVEAYKCLKDKYHAPADVLDAMKRADLSPVLTFLRQKARIYFTFVS
jgi:hypothetical protein